MQAFRKNHDFLSYMKIGWGRSVGAGENLGGSETNPGENLLKIFGKCGKSGGQLPPCPQAPTRQGWGQFKSSLKLSYESLHFPNNGRTK